MLKVLESGQGFLGSCKDNVEARWMDHWGHFGWLSVTTLAVAESKCY